MVSLSHKIPVHFTYFTATVDEKGKVQAFADVYGTRREDGLGPVRQGGQAR